VRRAREVTLRFDTLTLKLLSRSREGAGEVEEEGTGSTVFLEVVELRREGFDEESD
jgi:hypothetical protein